LEAKLSEKGAELRELEGKVAVTKQQLAEAQKNAAEAQNLVEAARIKALKLNKNIRELEGKVVETKQQFTEAQNQVMVTKKEVSKLNEKVTELTREEESLNLQIAALRSQKDNLLNVVKSRSNAQEALPIEAVVVPRADAKSKGNDRYDFSLWLETPSGRQQEIKNVTYFFNHPTFQKKIFSSSKPEDNFLVRYNGWGCLSRVIITVHLTDGTSKEIDFDMCSYLDWR
jgi:peptidoglycan hydrolase CwlO-like protein